MTGNPYQLVFEKYLQDFRRGLSRRDAEDFKMTTFNELEQAIGDLQAKQHVERQLRDLNRLGPFLEAISQYENVVGSLCGNNDLAAFLLVSLFRLLR